MKRKNNKTTIVKETTINDEAAINNETTINNELSDNERPKKRAKKEVNENDTFEVEEVVGVRVVGTQVQYELKWKRYGKKHNTWKPACELDDCGELVFEFCKKSLSKQDIKSYKYDK